MALVFAAASVHAGPPLWVDTSESVPSDAVVVFGGSDTDQLVGPHGEPCPWPVRDGTLVSTDALPQQQGLWTKLHFADAQVHCEFQLPVARGSEAGGEGAEGNSGLYFHGLYELQIRNTINSPHDAPETLAGALYGYSGPLVHAVRRPGEWQTYDVIFRAPKRGADGAVVREGSLTALLNGVLVQDHTAFGEPVSVYHPLRYATTAYSDAIKRSLAATGCGPLQLQYHNAAVRFRNVWIRPLDDRAFEFSGSPESTTPDAGLTVALVDRPPSPGAAVVQSLEWDSAGNTSVSNDSVKTIKHSSVGKPGYFVPEPGAPAHTWEEVGYFKRSRDLGQTFTYGGARACRLDAITLRTGAGSNIVRPGMFGAAVSLQLFEVSGEATLRENGTRAPNGAAHGFPHRAGAIPAERDDYFEGEVYRSLMVARGGRFPSREDFGLSGNASHRPDHEAFRGRLLRFDVSGDAEITLQPGRRYAFLVVIDEPAADRGFTLANRYYGSYPGGHGIRREGDGTLPPAPADPASPPGDTRNRQALAAARLPSDFKRRTAMPPGTRGFPDVDTHRDLYFVVESKEPRAAGG